MFFIGILFFVSIDEKATPLSNTRCYTHRLAPHTSTNTDMGTDTDTYTETEVDTDTDRERTRTRPRTRTHLQTQTHTRIHTHIHFHACLHGHARRHACTQSHTRRNTLTHKHTRSHNCKISVIYKHEIGITSQRMKQFLDSLLRGVNHSVEISYTLLEILLFQLEISEKSYCFTRNLVHLYDK